MDEKYYHKFYAQIEKELWKINLKIVKEMDKDDALDKYDYAFLASLQTLVHYSCHNAKESKETYE